MTTPDKSTWKMVLFKMLFVVIVTGSSSSIAMAKEDDTDECTLYLAPSSIPDFGFGMYTTKNHGKGSDLVQDAIIPTIPITDMKLHNQCSGKQRGTGDLLLTEYFWEENYSEAEFNEANDVKLFIGMIGSFATLHPTSSNVVRDGAHDPYNDSLVDRFGDPGAGAFSYHGSSKWITRGSVRAGSEVFTSNGNHQQRRYFLKNLPSNKNNKQGKEAFEEISAFLKKKTDAGEEVDDDAISAFKDIIASFDDGFASLIPSTSSSLLEMLSDDSTPSFSTNSKWVTAKSSVDNIKKYGVCLDNLRMDKSTIKQAGHGAFARRSIAKGQIVTPAPLLQVKRDVLKMYNLVQQKGTERMMCDPKNTEPVGEQLLANYCFGHVESSWLFCTPSNALLINHCSDRQDWGGDCGGKDGPNAMYRWSTGWDKKTEEWLGISVEEMEERTGKRESGLSLEIVATRDIQPGEEIFIDYGAEWEKAWNSHVENWKPPTGDLESFSSITKMNDEKIDVRTNDELAEEPYASNIFTGCVYWEEAGDDNENFNVYQNDDWKTLSDDELISRYGRSGEKYSATIENLEDSYYWPCSVYKRNGDKYVVRIEQSPQESDATWTTHDIPRILTDYPRESIRFYSKQYTSDVHLPGVFRQPIGIRDDIFPEQWKDLEK